MKIKKLWFEDDKIFIKTADDTILWQSLLWYPRLMLASQAQRKNFTIDDFGIRWEEIDEDISIESFLYEEKEPQNSIAQAFKKLPFLNVSKFSEKINIHRSLLAGYICGKRNPTNEQVKKIENALHKLGDELKSISLN